MQSPAAVKDVGGRNWVRGMENREGERRMSSVLV